MQEPNTQKQLEAIQAWQEQVLRIREKLFRERAERIERANSTVTEIARTIQLKHEMVKNRINKESVYREANIRVNRGLESLQRLVEVLRQSDTTDDLLERAIRDPVMSTSSRDAMIRSSASDFIRSIQQQLVAQTEFINIAAHELRTPIMPILASVETLEAELGKENEEVVVIKRNALRLMRLAEDILSLTKIAGGKIDLVKEEFNLSSLLSDILKQERNRIMAKNCQLVLKIADNISINADKDHISRIFLNLLDNAIKFTNRGGTISISAEKTDDEAIVSIRDTGPGISPTVFPILFRQFVTTSYKGTGLGLYISKELVEVHGGRIWAKNNSTESGNTGATFAFSLPL